MSPGCSISEIDGFWHDVFGFFSSSKRNTKLELRAKGLPKSVIKDAQAQGLNIQLDTKIWMEQMGLPYHPTHINRENQMDARHSYADLLEYPQTYHMNWTLWNGGTTRVLLWADPDYARRMAGSAPALRRPGPGGDGNGSDQNARGAARREAAGFSEFAIPLLRLRIRAVLGFLSRVRAGSRTIRRPTSDVWEQEYRAAIRRRGRTSRHEGAAAGEPGAAEDRRGQRSLPDVPHDHRLAGNDAPGKPAAVRAAGGGKRHPAVHEPARRSHEHPPGHGYGHAASEETSRWFAETSDAILAEVAAAERTARRRGCDAATSSSRR